jgi:hypothetical protein
MPPQATSLLLGLLNRKFMSDNRLMSDMDKTAGQDSRQGRVGYTSPLQTSAFITETALDRTIL